jgi:hypothetical protein
MGILHGMTDRDEEAGPGRQRDAWADLDLLTSDDVCSLLKVKMSWLYDTVESGATETMSPAPPRRLGPQRFALTGHGELQLKTRCRAATSGAVYRQVDGKADEY